MRKDGRGDGQLRKIKIKKNYLPTAEGSALVEFGKTRVICAATVSEGVPPFLKNSKQGWVTAEYSMLPRATTTRTSRERGKIGGRTQEIQRLIGRALRVVTELKALGENTIIVDCDVIQADGGTRSASISGGFVALALALERLKKDGVIEKIPLKDYLSAVSIGIVDGQILVDLNYDEDSQAQVDMNVVMTAEGKIVEVQGTAEKIPFSKAQLDQMLQHAYKGIKEICRLQKGVLGKIL